MNASSPIDVLAVGNALVDLLAQVDDQVVKSLGLTKGTTALVDQEESARLRSAVALPTRAAGGSAANTALGVAMLGASAGYIGRVADDELGHFFLDDMRAAGVVYEPAVDRTDPASGLCVSLVTPDGERTMGTYLGQAAELQPSDIDPDLVGRARWLYLEGYLWDVPGIPDALRKAAEDVRSRGGHVALTVSDPFAVERHGESFRSLLGDPVDLVFANEEEARLLFGVSSLAEVTASVQDLGVTGALTRGAAGSVVVTADAVVDVPARPVAAVVDTTGAGDLYAAGFLFGQAKGMGAERCAELGGLAAAEIISHLGARPLTSLRALAEEAGLL
ncbi:MAG: adenosine kinase [Acidimicrobiales bacterium]|nr:adenosine kinase [Acidimicrobiales bacterium]MBO0886011.1 adenosine kinase [Acidimicrobiales bacterium]